MAYRLRLVPTEIIAGVTLIAVLILLQDSFGHWSSACLNIIMVKTYLEVADASDSPDKSKSYSLEFASYTQGKKGVRISLC